MADEPKQEVARFAPTRIPYHPAVMERFNVDQAGWRALVDAVWPGARTAEAVVLALSYCKARKLDPFKRPVHIVGVWSREQKRVVESCWPGIGELRTTAFRTGLYAGREATEWGPDRELSFDGATVTYPEWAQVTVHRLDRTGNPRPYPGPRVYWLESYATAGRDTVAPNEMWRRRTRGQLDKCAEAAALRAAFPEELGNDYSSEEMEGQVVDHAPAEPAPASSPPLRGNEALRSRLAPAPDEPAQTSAADSRAATPAAEVPPEPPRRRRRQSDEPTEAEIDRSQDMLAAVLGDEELERLDEQTLLPDEAIKPQRLPRDAGWDWPSYADELIEAARQTPKEELPQFRAANASMVNVLRTSAKAQWTRVNEALADYEREG